MHFQASLENDDAEDDPVSWVDSRTNARIFCQPLEILTKEPLDQPKIEKK